MKTNPQRQYATLAIGAPAQRLGISATELFNRLKHHDLVRRLLFDWGMKKLFVVILFFYAAATWAQFNVNDAAPIGIDAASCDKKLLLGYPRIYEFYIQNMYKDSCIYPNDDVGLNSELDSEEDSAEDLYGPVRHSYRIDMPTDDSPFGQNVRQWMAKMISSQSQFGNYYIAAFDHSPVTMSDAISEDFFEDYLHANHEELYFYDEAFDFYRYYESPTYVTYRFGSNSMMGSNQVRYSTFDKKNGQRLSLSDLIHPEKDHAWRLLVLKHIMTALKERHEQHGTKYSHYFLKNIIRDEFSIDNVRMDDVALWPNGMVVCFQASDIDDLNEGRYEILIPYEELADMLLVPPMEREAKDVFFKSYKKACAHADFIEKTERKRAPVYTEQYLNELATPYGRRLKKNEQQHISYSSPFTSNFKNIGVYLHALDRTAEMAYRKQQWDVAARLYEEYLSVAEICCETDDEAWWQPATKQLECLMKCQRYDDVLTLGRKLCPAQKKLANLYGETNAYRWQHVTLTTMAEAAYLSNHADEAMKFLEQAMPLSKLFGCDHADAVGEKGVCHVHLTDSMNLMRYQQALGMQLEVVENAKKVAPLVRMALFEDFRYTSSNDRKSRWQKMEKWYTEFLPYIALQTKDNELIAHAYDAVLFGRGLLLNSDVAIRQILLEKGTDEEKALIDSVEAAKKELEAIQNADMREDDRLLRIEEIHELIDELEWNITNSSFNYEDFTQRLFINHKAVRSRLSEKDIAIEFLRFTTSADSVMYAALTLRKDYGEPKMTLLFEERQLTNSHSHSLNPYLPASITHLIWEPLAKELEDIDNIYFSPIGELYKIGIEYASGMERYHLYRLSSTRMITTEKASTKDENGEKIATLFGGLEYHFDSSDWANLEKQNDKSKQSAFRDVPLIDRGAWCERISFLPGSKEEVIEIDKLLCSCGQKTILLTSTEGTEDAFKQLSGKHTSILHISTHGFYETNNHLTTSVISVQNTSQVMQSTAVSHEAESREYDDLALSRSGLFMAGAADALNENTYGNTPNGVDDGVLTAREIAQLDLRTVDLVVLSACETGLGDITGDGVFGLQRGFKKAGASTLIMSLWKVDDRATQLLMTEFYQGLTAGLSKHQAFMNAQQHLRQCEGGKYNTPEYWAAFILLDAKD